MESLATIQKALKVPKNQFNKFGGYNYRSCEDILEAVKPLLGDCILTLSDDVFHVADRYYVKATATLIDPKAALASPDCQKSVSVSAYAREIDVWKGRDAAQITGSASSYARKYALNGLFLLCDVQDADSQLPPESTPTQGPHLPPPDQQEAKMPEEAKISGQPHAAKPPDEWPAPTQVERGFLNMLRDFYKAQLPARKFMPTKLLKLTQLHLARFPSSQEDCELCKRYIKAAELME